MHSLPQALVVTNFPIISNTVISVFQGRYDVHTLSWNQFIDRTPAEVDVVIVDVTTIAEDAALPLLAHMLPDARIVVCSLHQNEVRIYRSSSNGLVIEKALNSLFDLAA